MFYSDLIFLDTANGPGFRTSLFVSGCTLRCEGCFNQAAQNFRNGQVYTQEVEDKIIRSLMKKHVRGLSLLGGDPLEPKNFETVLQLCRNVKIMLPEKDIWLWTGRTYEEIQPTILETVDIIIEGRFVLSLKDESLLYRGSSNQKILRAKDGSKFS